MSKDLDRSHPASPARAPEHGLVESLSQADLDRRREEYNHRMQRALINVLQERGLFQHAPLMDAVENLFLGERSSEVQVVGVLGYVSISVPFNESMEDLLNDALVSTFEDFLDKLPRDQS